MGLDNALTGGRNPNPALRRCVPRQSFVKFSLWHLLPWHEGASPLRISKNGHRPPSLGRGHQGWQVPELSLQIILAGCDSICRLGARRENGSRQIPFGGVARAQGHGVTRNSKRADGWTGSTAGLPEACRTGRISLGHDGDSIHRDFWLYCGLAKPSGSTNTTVITTRLRAPACGDISPCWGQAMQ